MWNKDERDGKVEQAKGRVKQAAGDLTHNKHLRVEGEIEEATGQVREAAGQIRHKAADALADIAKTVKK